MDCKKKVRNNMIMAVIYIILGLALIICACVVSSKVDTGYISSLGSCFTILGFAMLVKFIRIKRDPELMRKFEITLKDERNRMISDKAKVYTFAVYSVGAAIAVIICGVFYMKTEAVIIACNLCALVLLYIIFTVILHKKY